MRKIVSYITAILFVFIIVTGCSTNDGRNPVAYLPKLLINKADQVVKVINEKNNELISVIRIKGTNFKPQVFVDGTYTIIVGEGKTVNN